MSKARDELQEKIKGTLDGVWHSRSVNDVLPEILSQVDTYVKEIIGEDRDFDRDTQTGAPLGEEALQIWLACL